jgi:hypothetical protein
MIYVPSATSVRMAMLPPIWASSSSVILRMVCLHQTLLSETDQGCTAMQRRCDADVTLPRIGSPRIVIEWSPSSAPSLDACDS